MRGRKYANSPRAPATPPMCRKNFLHIIWNLGKLSYLRIMQPSLLHIVLSDGAAKAVCWTLVHSTWEGIAAALLAGAIILSTRKHAAALRYNLLTANLLLFLLGAGFTFYYELSRSGPAELSAS